MKPIALPLLLCSALLLSCGDDDSLGAAVDSYRPWQLRLSFQNGYDSCEPAPPAADTTLHSFTPLACAPPTADESRRILEVAARQRALHTTTGDSTAVLGRIDLLLPGSAAAHDRAVRNLEMAVRQDSSAPLLNDLGVAYAVRSAAREDARDLLLALESVLRAVRLDSTFIPALYNRALLLDRLSLTGAAAAAWEAYVRVEPDERWAGERPLRVVERPALDLQPLREDSARLLLARWAASWLNGDTATADAALRAAQHIGTQLRDATVADAVRVIYAADPQQRRRLAEAQSSYEEGERAFTRAAFTEARPLLEQAARAFAQTTSPFRWWTDLALSGVHMYEGDTPTTVRLTDAVLRSADTGRYPALIARAHWIQALTEARLGTYERGLAAYALAGSLYESAGEGENAGAIEFLIASSLQLLGQARTAERRMLDALEMLAPYPGSPRLHDGLLGFGRYMTTLGLFETARALHEEGLRVAERTGRSKDPGEVHVRLAQTAFAAGRPQDAAHHLTLARAIFRTVDDPVMREREEIDIVDTESALALQEAPAEAVRLLSSAVEYFTSGSLAPGSIRALTRRSAALRAEGRHPEAAADLVRAIELYEHSVEGATITARAALQESAAPAYDAMIAVQLALDRPDSAFAWLMRSRGGSAAAVETAAARSGAPVLAYAVLPRELVTWRFDGARWQAQRATIDADSIATLVTDFNNALRRREDLQARHAGAALHRLLLRDVGTAASLLIVPDRVLSQLPFSALRDPVTDDYLAQHTQVSIYAPGPGADAPRSSTPRVLVASGGRFDARTFPDLSPLPAAEEEARRVSALYDDAMLLKGDAATPDRLLEELRRRDVLHFAGHARALPGTPELSFLVTATGTGGQNRITAADIMRLDLGHVRLVVLGACSSAERGSGRNGDVSGLAQAFLAAGADAVVASVWEVEDVATAELLTRMHEHLRAGAAPGQALRDAQLELLGSTDPRLRAPAAWAGFQHYTS